MAISIKDVAKKANVSITTVSRVINNSKPVSEELRLRVMEVIEETGFKPNMMAKSLVNKESKLIGVIIPKISNSYFSNLIEGIEEVAKLYDYNIIITSSNGDEKKETQFLSIFKDRQMDGIIFCVTKFTQEHKEFYEKVAIPTVFVGQKVKETPYPYITINNFQASYEMCRYLIQEGFKKIAYIRGPKKDVATGHERYKGFEKAMVDAELPINNKWICFAEQHHTIHDGYFCAQKIMASGEVPDVICVASDLLAVGAINYLIDNGFNVPNDISVVGFDDSEVASIVRPKLTTIKQDPTDMGSTAMRMVIEQIKADESIKKEVLLPYQIVTRDSVKKSN